MMKDQGDHEKVEKRSNGSVWYIRRHFAESLRCQWVLAKTLYDVCLLRSVRSYVKLLRTLYTAKIQPCLFIEKDVQEHSYIIIYVYFVIGFMLIIASRNLSNQ